MSRSKVFYDKKKRQNVVIKGGQIQISTQNTPRISPYHTGRGVSDDDDNLERSSKIRTAGDIVTVVEREPINNYADKVDKATREKQNKKLLTDIKRSMNGGRIKLII